MSEGARRLESIHVVRTPEYVEFDFQVAGIASRFLAWLIDVSVATAIAVVLSIVIWMLGSPVPGVASALTFILWFLVNWGYFVLLEYRWAGRTLGKKALGLRTIQESGVRIGFYGAVIRNLVRAVDHLPVLYLLGGGMALASAKGQRLGDLAAGTIVVRERRRPMPSEIGRPAEAMAALGADPRVEERVRRASVEEREVLLSAVLRREELSMPARLSLFRKLAGYLSARFGVEKPAHLSDERFVVSVVGLMVREPANVASRVRAARRVPAGENARSR